MQKKGAPGLCLRHCDRRFRTCKEALRFRTVPLSNIPFQLNITYDVARMI